MLQLRDDLGPHSNSGPTSIGVGRVIDPRHAEVFQVRGKGPATEGQERPHDRSPAGRYACQSPQIRAPHQPEQHGFRLIVGMVSDGQAIGSSFSDQAFQPAIAGIPQTGLIDHRGNRRRAHMARDTELRRQFVRPRPVGLGADPNLVIEVSRFQAQVETRSELRQQVEKGRRVRSP